MNWGISVDQDTLVASFAGAMAYLCTRDKMPVVRAAAYAFAGTAAAAYFGPALADWAVSAHYIEAGSKRMYGAVVFATGVGGIWIINLIVSVLEAFGKQSGDFVAGVLKRFRGGQ